MTVVGNLTVANSTKTVHIANFPEFFKISAFFIAFVLLYLITVPLMMQYLVKSWKVISGLVSVLRTKGYSTKMVSIICSSSNNLDKLLVYSLDNVDHSFAFLCPRHLGHDFGMEPLIQLPVWNRNLVNRNIFAVHFPGIC